MADPTYQQAVTELARLAKWPKSDVKDKPRDAAWVAYGWIAKCRSIVEAGDL